MSFIYHADRQRGLRWKQYFADHAPHIPFHIWPETGDPEAVRFIGTWSPEAIEDLSRFPNLEAIFSIGAGIDQFDLTRIPPQIPLIRMQEPGIVSTMREYVLMAALGIHRNLVDYIDQQRREVYEIFDVKPVAETTIGVLGMGQLGTAVASILSSIGFDCRGWSRSGKPLQGVQVFKGEEELSVFLAGCDILVCLLPLTAETRGILNSQLFSKLPKGASLINVGRGDHLVEADLLNALESGQLSSAVLDVQSPEPLPKGHPFWQHPQILMTPHIASQTQPESAAAVLLENIDSLAQGKPVTGLVDRSRGY